MQGTYSYVPETNHVSTAYTVAAVLYLQLVLHVMIFRNMFCILLRRSQWPRGLSRRSAAARLLGLRVRVWWSSWLRRYATNRQVAVSIPDGVIGIFH
jgi:hypothetical protein